MKNDKSKIYMSEDTVENMADLCVLLTARICNCPPTLDDLQILGDMIWQDDLPFGYLEPVLAKLRHVLKRSRWNGKRQTQFAAFFVHLMEGRSELEICEVLLAMSANSSDFKMDHVVTVRAKRKVAKKYGRDEIAVNVSYSGQSDSRLGGLHYD